MLQGTPRGHRWKRKWNRHMWGRRRVHETARPPRRAPWRRTGPRQAGSDPNPAPPDHGPGPQPPRISQECGSAQCRGAHAARGPRRRGGAACSRWCPTSASAAPPNAWLHTHGLRVCLACREITPQRSRCPAPRCSTAVLAALALGNTAPSAQARSPLAGPLPSGLDLVYLLGTRIPTLRRTPIAASSTCARCPRRLPSQPRHAFT